jgi:hypothetical protein
MSEFDEILGKRDAALLRNDMATVEVLEVEIQRRAANLRRALVHDFLSETRGMMAAFEGELLRDAIVRPKLTLVKDGD